MSYTTFDNNSFESDNLGGMGNFFRRGGRWVTAEELATLAIEDMFADLSRAYAIGWGSASDSPLDLFKMTVAEGGIRSPMLISGPGIKGGRQVNTFSYVWDIMPTVLELTGIPHPKKYRGRQVERMRGKSLKDVLKGLQKAA